jgi:hypothetical protein
MENRHGFSQQRMMKMLVHDLHIDHEKKLFAVVWDWRDYEKNYCVRVELTEELFLEHLKQYTEMKKAGYQYKGEPVATYHKGNDNK